MGQIINAPPDYKELLGKIEKEVHYKDELPLAFYQMVAVLDFMGGINIGNSPKDGYPGIIEVEKIRKELSKDHGESWYRSLRDRYKDVYIRWEESGRKRMLLTKEDAKNTLYRLKFIFSAGGDDPSAFYNALLKRKGKVNKKDIKKECGGKVKKMSLTHFLASMLLLSLMGIVDEIKRYGNRGLYYSINKENLRKFMEDLNLKEEKTIIDSTTTSTKA